MGVAVEERILADVRKVARRRRSRSRSRSRSRVEGERTFGFCQQQTLPAQEAYVELWPEVALPSHGPAPSRAPATDTLASAPDVCRIIEWISSASWSDLPKEVQHQAARCVADIVGVAAASRSMPTAQIMQRFVKRQHGGTDSDLWFGGGPISAVGAALAHASAIDSLDAHEGFYNKYQGGHIMVAALPALLSVLRLAERPISGHEFLLAVVICYEIAARASCALHATASEYHSSGTWSGIGCAAGVGRLLGLDGEQLRHAMGIAEYYGPRAPMMRCIDHPSNVKDSSGMGAHAGVSAALLAMDGFSGAPALLIEGVRASEWFADLGNKWFILTPYTKQFPVCRWAQPAVECALQLDVRPDDIVKWVVRTFHEAARLSSRQPAVPKSPDQAQYSLLFPVAAAFAHHKLGPKQVSWEGITDEATMRLCRCGSVEEDSVYSRRYPPTALATVEVHTASGQVLRSSECCARWEADQPASDAELLGKLQGLMAPERANAVLEFAWACERGEVMDVNRLQDMLVAWT